MCVRIDASRNNEHTFRIKHCVSRHIQRFSDHRNFFVFDKYISEVIVDGSNNSSVSNK